MQKSNSVLVHVISTLAIVQLWYVVSLILNKIPWKTGDFIFFVMCSW